jgi:glycosyltransferase involved in cell wall biosynthesis
MQVAHLPVEDMVAVEKHATGVVVLSRWAGEFLQHQGLEFGWDRIAIRPNGVDLSRYPRRDDLGIIRDGPMSFVYSSSPDRGLYHLLRAWPKLRVMCPGARLYVAYGATRWTSVMKWSHARQGEISLSIEEGMQQDGVVDVGILGADDLASLQLNATAWLYPADTIMPTETGCITAVEAGAAGTPMVITDCDCLGSEFGRVAAVMPMPYDEDTYLWHVQQVIGDAEAYSNMALQGRALAETRDWREIAASWIPLFVS